MSDFHEIQDQLLHQLEVAGATADRLVDATPEETLRPESKNRWDTAPVCQWFRDPPYDEILCSARQKATIKSLRTRIKSMHKELSRYGLR